MAVTKSLSTLLHIRAWVKIFRPDIHKLRQMENAAKGIQRQLW